MSIGQALSTARAERGLTVDDVSRSTRMRATLVRDIERDEFASSGGAVYARGHIRNIAGVVGVDGAAMLAEFDRLYGAPAPLLRSAAAPLEPDEFARRDLRARRGPNWSLVTVVVLLVVTIVAAVALLRGGSTPAGGQPGRGAGPAPAVSPGLTGPATVTSEPSPNPTVTYTGVVLEARIRQNASWVSISEDGGNLLFQGLLQPGTVREFRSSGALLLTIGNAGAVDVIANGHDLGMLGAAGAVLNLQFDAGDPTHPTPVG